jgi:hypothetical protein
LARTLAGFAISPISFTSGSIKTFSIAAFGGAKSPYEVFWPWDFVLAVGELIRDSPMLTDPLFDTLLIFKEKILITVCILPHPFYLSAPIKTGASCFFLFLTTSYAIIRPCVIKTYERYLPDDAVKVAYLYVSFYHIVNILFKKAIKKDIVRYVL